MTQEQAKTYLHNNSVLVASGCWEWQGTFLNSGYGRCTRNIEGANAVAHRASYQTFNGPLIAGMEIDHLCSNRRCINPDHLEQVEPNENDRRRRRTHCRQGHELTPENSIIVFNPDGVTYRVRACRTCHNTRKLARYHAKKQLKTEVSAA